MKISTKGRYALRIMVDLAQHDNGGYTPLKEISERQEISMKYLETIISHLNKAGFVESVRGKGGGHRLAKPAQELTVGSVLELVEGTLAPVSCLEGDRNHCDRANTCYTLPMWQELNRIIAEYLGSVTIYDLVHQQDQLIGNDYSI
ncbi:MAG: RrF2 family transcriptional regulator [Actinobacteria bacterium]|nr:RrF2 family transcriptional regulator [Actinomycetota bacterium]